MLDCDGVEWVADNFGSDARCAGGPDGLKVHDVCIMCLIDYLGIQKRFFLLFLFFDTESCV